MSSAFRNLRGSGSKGSGGTPRGSGSKQGSGGCMVGGSLAWPLTQAEVTARGGAPARDGKAALEAYDATEALVFQILTLHLVRFRQTALFKQLVEFAWREAQPPTMDYFIKFRVIGRGGYGMVFGCRTLTTGKMYACKEIDMKRIKEKQAEDLCYSEHDVLKRLSTPFAVNLKYAFHEKTKLVLIMDLMMGGDLKYWLKVHGRFDATRTQYYAAQTLLALRAIHDLGIVYRDMKPENLLVDEKGRVKVSDMGLAVRAAPDLRGCAGTPGYLAPEMIAGDFYDYAVDLFSFGCMVVEFITGHCPFRTKEAKAWTVNNKKKKQTTADEASQPPPPQADNNNNNKNNKNNKNDNVEYGGTQQPHRGLFGRSNSCGKQQQPPPQKPTTDEKEEKKRAMIKSIERAVLEMAPDLSDAAFDHSEFTALSARAFCAALLEKMPQRRLGAQRGCPDILDHAFFATLNWDAVRSPNSKAPFEPGRALNFNHSDKIGVFESLGNAVKIEPGDFDRATWTYTSTVAYQSEAVWLLKWIADKKKQDPDWSCEFEDDDKPKSSFCALT